MKKQMLSHCKSLTLFLVSHFKILGFVIMLLVSSAVFAQIKDGLNSNISDTELIEQFINAKGYKSFITFDSSNIKQFWTSKSVSSQNGLINIVLNNDSDRNWKSELLKIQLVNVLLTQDCKITIITNDNDLKFSVTGNESIVLSTSTMEEDFIQYHIASATFHLEDTHDFSFYLVFSSNTIDVLAIKKILITFSNNKESHYLGNSDFDTLSKQIENDGTPVPNSDVKYLVSKEYNKVFIMLPDTFFDAYPFFYHDVPVDDNDFISTYRKQVGFNNRDFNNNSPYLIIPKPGSSNSKYTIIQRALPPYNYSKIQIGQYDANPPHDYKWTFVLPPSSQQK